MLQWLPQLIPFQNGCHISPLVHLCFVCLYHRSDPPAPPQHEPQPPPSYHYQPSSITLPRPTRTTPIVPSSRLSNTLLRYTPGQYSQRLQNSPSPPGPLILRIDTDSGSDSVDASTSTRSDTSIQTSSPPTSPGFGEDPPEDLPSPTYSPVPRTSPSRVYTPFMRLMEISAKLGLE